MTIDQVNELKCEIEEKNIELHSLRLQLHIAVQEQNIHRVMVYYNMIEECQGIITFMSEEIDEYAQLN